MWQKAKIEGRYLVLYVIRNKKVMQDKKGLAVVVKPEGRAHSFSHFVWSRLLSSLNHHQQQQQQQ